MALRHLRFLIYSVYFDLDLFSSRHLRFASVLALPAVASRDCPFEASEFLRRSSGDLRFASVPTRLIRVRLRIYYTCIYVEVYVEVGVYVVWTTYVYIQIPI